MLKPADTERPNGLVVGYLLWVQGIPGSNPGWAPPFCSFPGSPGSVNCDRAADAAGCANYGVSLPLPPRSMEKFETLQPTRLYVPDVKTGKLGRAPTAPAQFVGRLPIDIHILVLIHLPIPDFPAYARCSRSLSNLSRHEKVWEVKWNALRLTKHTHFKALLDQLEDAKKIEDGGLMKNVPPTLAVGDVDDDFGDFAQAQVPTTPGFMAIEVEKSQMHTSVSSMRPPACLELYRRAHRLLKPYTTSLSFPPHAILASLFPSVPGVPPIPLLQQSRILHLLLLWLSPQIQPLRKWMYFSASLRSAIDRYEANLLAAFDIAESRMDEKGMTEAAEASWEVFDAAGEWELGRVWAEKQEIFYEAAKWNPMDNLTYVPQSADQFALLINLVKSTITTCLRRYGRVHEIRLDSVYGERLCGRSSIP